MLSPRRNSMFSPYGNEQPSKRKKYSVTKSQIQFPLRVYNFVDAEQQQDDYQEYIDPSSPILFNHIYDLYKRPKTAATSQFSRIKTSKAKFEYQQAMSTYATIKAAVNNTLTDTFLNSEYVQEVQDDEPETFLITQINNYNSPQYYVDHRKNNSREHYQRREIDYNYLQPNSVPINTLIDRNLPSPIRAARNKPLRSQLSTALRKQPINNQPPGFTIEFKEQEIQFPNQNVQYVQRRPMSSRYPVLMSWGK